MFKGLIVFISLVMLSACGSGGSGGSNSPDTPEEEVARNLYEGSWQSNCFLWTDSGYLVDVREQLQAELDDLIEADIETEEIWVKETLTLSNEEIGHKFEFFNGSACLQDSPLEPIISLIFHGGDWVDPIISQQTLSTSEDFEFVLYETQNSVIPFAPYSERNIYLGYYQANDQLYMVKNQQETIFEVFDGIDYQVDFNTVVYARQ